MIISRTEGFVAMTREGQFLNADPTSKPTSNLQEAKFNPPVENSAASKDIILIRAERIVSKNIQPWDGKSDQAVVVTHIGTFAKDSAITDFVQRIQDACVFDVERATLACIEKGEGFYPLYVQIDNVTQLLIITE